MQETLSDVLVHFVHRSQYSRGQLAALSGVPKRTIANWVEGRVKKPQQWQGVVALAAVLHLNESETSRLLQAAFHPTIDGLRQKITTKEEMALLAAWPKKKAPPFQPHHDLPYFVGREHALQAIEDELLKGSLTQICTVKGMAGVGKTAVAIKTTYRLKSYFPDGVLWANLATSEIMTILSTFAKTFDQDVSQLTNMNDRSAFVRGILANKRVLIILDEAQSSEQIRPLLPPSTGKPAVIITTQYDLSAVDGFKKVEIKPFDPRNGHSIGLFTKFLGESIVQQHRDELEEIATLLGHLPLAIAVVAARITYSSAQTIGNYLANIRVQKMRLDQLTREDQGVRLSFDISYHSMSPDLRYFFSILGLFGGEDFSLKAVAATTEMPITSTTERLNELVRLSLVREEANNRYGLHPLLRDYAREKMSQSSSVLRMVNFYLAYIRQHLFDYHALDLELSNILAAFQTSFENKLSVPIIDGVNTLYPFLELCGLHDIAEHFLRLALQLADANNDVAHTGLIYSNLGHLMYLRADYAQAETFIQTGISLAQQAGDPHYRSRLYDLVQAKVRLLNSLR